MNDAGSSWIQSDKAGYRDRNGRYASGNDIMHLDRIRAGFSPPMDIGWIRLALDYNDQQSAPVRRLGNSNGEWEVDLEMGAANGFGPARFEG